METVAFYRRKAGRLVRIFETNEANAYVPFLLNQLTPGKVSKRLGPTSGRDLPAPRIEQDLQTPEGFAWGLEQLKQVALELPEVADIELRPRLMGDPSKARGWYVHASRQIVVVTGEQSDGSLFRTLVHETAHALLHPKGDHHSTPPEREVEAESTAFVVCHSLGLDCSETSFPYVAEWAHGMETAKQLATTGQRILTAATRLLEVLAPEATCQKEAA